MDQSIDTDQSSNLELLYSSSEESDSKVDIVRVRVNIPEVPSLGVIDSGLDITIMKCDLLCKVATVAKLQKKDLKQPDRSPRSR